MEPLHPWVAEACLPDTRENFLVGDAPEGSSLSPFRLWVHWATQFHSKLLIGPAVSSADLEALSHDTDSRTRRFYLNHWDDVIELSHYVRS